MAEDNGLLQRSYLYMKSGREEKILQTIRAMQKGGRDKLLVISDFDMTLTQYYANGSCGNTSYSVVETSNFMPEAYREECLTLRKKYASREVDPSQTEEERTKVMNEWYSQAHQTMVEHKLKKKDLRDIIAMGNIKLRDGCDALISLLNSSGVPMVILSAGIADTLILAMEMQMQQKVLNGNIKVISNRLQFDDSGVLIGFSKPMITSCNKQNAQEQFAALSADLKGRCNVLLLGDSLGDPQMVGGMETPPEQLIKIGFLNHDEEKLLPTYQELYDIVLTGDGDMSVILDILKSIPSTI